VAETTATTLTANFRTDCLPLVGALIVTSNEMRPPGTGRSWLARNCKEET
jgi:hypothetical protein